MAAPIEREDVEVQLIGDMPYLAAVPSATLDRLFTQAINGATSQFERELETSLVGVRIKMRPSPDLVLGTDYDVEESPLDYMMGSIDRTTLPRYVMQRRPIVAVDSFRMEFSAQHPVITVPLEWVKTYKEEGVISIAPMGTAALVAGSSAIWFAPLVAGSWQWNVIPQFVCIDYRAGTSPAQADPYWGDLLWHLATEASCRVLEACQRLIPDGTNVDGFSQNFANVGTRVRELRRGQDGKSGIAAFLADWQKRNLPPMMAML